MLFFRPDVQRDKRRHSLEAVDSDMFDRNILALLLLLSHERDFRYVASEIVGPSVFLGSN